MKIKCYANNEEWRAGITLRDESEPEAGNMALHSCKNPHDILENRKKLAAFLGCDPGDFVCARQTHGSRFHRVTRDDKGRGAFNADTAISNTDALYTYEPNLLLCCFSADCVPVLFYHEGKGLVGVIHSGWKGTVQEITLQLFEHLKRTEGCSPRDFHVQLGMALSQEKFEVDADVYVKFKELGYADHFIYFNAETNKYHIDNQLTVKKQCELAGIPSEHISIDRTCTYASPDGFSYRRDQTCGRHLSFVRRQAFG
jgi:hypothetical protein